MKKEQERRNDPSKPSISTKPSISESFAPCPLCQRTNHPPENFWTGLNTAIRPKRYKQDHPADNQNDGQDHSLTHPGLLSVLKNPLN